MTSTSHCPFCAGDGVPLGILGHLRWFRCRDCGMTLPPSNWQILENQVDALSKEGDTHGKHFRDTPENTG
jgi:hypothetical protein